MNIILTLLTTTTQNAVDKIFDKNAGDVLLDENGQFLDPSQTLDNVTTWWEKLDLVNKIIEKIPSLVIAVIMILIGIFLSRIVSKLLVKAMKARNVLDFHGITTAGTKVTWQRLTSRLAIFGKPTQECPASVLQLRDMNTEIYMSNVNAETIAPDYYFQY